MLAQLRTPALRTFFIIWIGQFVSIVGSSLTRFALGVWVFQQTGRTTDFALIAAFFTLPAISLAPLAGSIVDRYNRRTVMIVADIAAGCSTILIAMLLSRNELVIWHIYLATFLNSAANVFQSPAYSAAMTQLVPKDLLPRANGLISLGQSISGIAAPVIAGFLVVQFGLWSVITVDLLTFIFAVGTLLFVQIPDVEPMKESTDSPRSIWHDTHIAWRFMRERRGLFALLIFNAAINVIAVSELLITPLVLSFSSEDALGFVLGMGGLGFFVGSLVMSVWGGSKRLIIGVVLFECLAGLSTFSMGLQASVIWIAMAVFSLHFAYPVLDASNNTLWQRKVPNAMQGRVMALRQMLMWLLIPLTFLLAGPLVDNVLQPMLTPDGVLANSIGRIIGVGQGRGIALMMIVTGSINIIAGLAAASYKPLWNIETELPDGDMS
jgi:MFS transporter, DHA3 family, macrolide efflux protein